MELKHTKAGPQGMPQGPEQQEKDSGHMLEANAMGAHPLDASTPPVQRKPSGADTLTASTGPNPGAKTAASGGGTEGAEAAPSTQPGGQARAHSDKPMLISSIKLPGMPQAIVNRLAGEEKIRQDVYVDSRGLLTVGLGHCLTKDELLLYKKGDVFSEAEIVALATQDFGGAWAAAERQCAELGLVDEDFKEALLHVNFQVGTGWNTKFKKTWALMKAGQWEAAAEEVAESDWNAQTPGRVANFQSALRKLGPGTSAPKADGDWKAYKEEQKDKKTKAPASAPLPQDPDLILKTQTKLKAMGLYPTEPDGKPGPKTKSAVKAFQAKAGLKASGEIDAATWAALQGIGRSFLNGPVAAEKSKEKANGALPKDKSPKGVAEFARAQAGMLQHEQALAVPEGGIELDMMKHWNPQEDGSTNCNEVAYSMVLGHKAEHPDLYEDFGGIGGQMTERPNSLHLVWEKDHELGGSRLQGGEKLSVEELEPTLERDELEWGMGLRYILACLKEGVPVMVGVNHRFAYKRAAGNPDQTTDHWLTIVGVGQDNKGRYLSYFDPGRGAKADGTDTEANRMYETAKPHIWADPIKYGDTDAGKGSYTLVAVALYSTHRGKAEFKVGDEVFKRKL